MSLTDTTPITFSVAGGGIFVFENDTTKPLSEVDVNIAVSDALAVHGFSVTGTIVVPSGPPQNVSFGSGFVPNSNCVGASLTTFCEQLTFALIPGPIVPIGGHFVLDFDDPNHYTALDVAIAAGTYTGDTVDGPDQMGSWGSMAQAYVTPIVAPEPQYTGFLAGILGVAILVRRRATAG